MNARVRRSFSMEAVKAQFAEKKSPSTNNTNTLNDYYPHWLIDIGKDAIVRYVPDKNPDNPWFLLERYMHELTIDGRKRKIPCFKNYDPKAECPMCKKSVEFYELEGKTSVRGKQLYRKLQWLGQVLVIDDPLPPNPETGEKYTGKVKPVLIGTQIYESIDLACQDGDVIGAPHDYDKGTNFIIKKMKSGDYSDYSRSKFARESTVLDDATVDYIEETIVDLRTLLPAKPTMESMLETLNLFLNGSSGGAPAARVASASEIIQSTPTVSISSGPTVAAPTITATSVEEADDDDTDEIIAQLKARRAVAAQR